MCNIKKDNSVKKNRNLIEAFNNAIEGVLYTFKNEKNIKIHYLCAIGVLFSSLFFNLDKIEMIIIFMLIGGVIICEMFNTAIEKAIDGVSTEYNPLFKVAKDVSAGAVLISSMVAVAGGYLIFYDKVSMLGNVVLDSIRTNPTHITIICIILVLIWVVILKSLTPKGTPLKGGMPSGHSALAFSIATITTLLTKGLLVTVLSYTMALLVAQSRVEGKIHSFIEVVAGALLGIFIAILVFQIAIF